MKLYAAVARRRLGMLRKDDRGRELVCEADAWMAAEAIRNPSRMTRLIPPSGSFLILSNRLSTGSQ